MRSSDNPSVVMDSLVTAISIVAMRLMSLKAHQAWLAWALANGLSIYLFTGQALYATAGLYAVPTGALVCGASAVASKLVQRIAVVGG